MGKRGRKDSLTVDEDLFQYSWEDGQQNHTEQDQPDHPQSTPPLTWEMGGPEQKGMRLINQSLEGQFLFVPMQPIQPFVEFAALPCVLLEDFFSSRFLIASKTVKPASSSDPSGS